MPDNEDYRFLGSLLDTVDEWTPADLETARWLLENQKVAVSRLHPKDRQRSGMTAVAESLERAIARAQARQ